jgi:group I intron endonuclease
MAKEKKTGIYKISNKEDGKIYIGQAKDIEKRWKTHKRGQYPEDKFTYEILMECDLEQLNFWEIAWITSENACDPDVGYNKTLGGTSLKVIIKSDEVKAKISAARKGKKVTDETKAKTSATLKGRKLTDEHKAKMSASNIGRKLTDEHKAKISATLKGREYTDETKAKISTALKGRKRTAETKAKISATLKSRELADAVS